MEARDNCTPVPVTNKAPSPQRGGIAPNRARPHTMSNFRPKTQGMTGYNSFVEKRAASVNFETSKIDRYEDLTQRLKQLI